MDWWKKKKMKKHRWVRGRDREAMLLEDLIVCCDGKSNPIKFFSANQIIKATDNFSNSNLLLSSSRIIDYKLYSSKNEKHYIIKVADNRDNGEDVCRDITISSMVSGHKNFMKLVGCCLEFERQVMVYNSVKKHYTLDLIQQPWKKRMKIAQDIATALAYLHTSFSRPFVHRTLSFGQILLDEDGVAKLSDFSACISIPEGETFVEVDRIMGTYGHLDPNYAFYGVVSEKTDVFAIGIVMQKFLTGEERFHKLRKEEERKEEGESESDGDDDETISVKSVPCFGLSKSMEDRRMDTIADPKMLDMMDEITEEDLCRMNDFLMLSQRCIGIRGEVPTMVDVAKELKKIQRSARRFSSSSTSGDTHFDSQTCLPGV